MTRSGRVLLRNSAINLTGFALPLLAAVVSIPILVAHLGTDRFGLLTLAWMAVGYFSLWDFGLGKAITKMVAERLGGDAEGEISGVAWTGLYLLAAGGLVSGVALAIAVEPITDILRIPDGLVTESIDSLYLLAVGMPFVVVSTGLRAVLEGLHRFGATNSVRIPMGLLTFLGPLAVLPWGGGLVAAIAVLVVGRIVGTIVYLALCLGSWPSLRELPRLEWHQVRPLLGYGGWMAISNMLAPIMAQFDRVFVGAAISMAAVAYYVTPFEAVMRLSIIPVAVMGVLFPAFAALGETRQDLVPLVERSRRALIAVIFPACLVIIVGAEHALGWWVGPEFAARSTRVAQILAVGVFINALGNVPYTLLQSAGRPDITAKLHLLEIPVYLLLLWLLIPTLGIDGVALASTIRLAMDTTLLFHLSQRYITPDWRMKPVLMEGGFATVVLVLAISAQRLPHIEMVALGILTAFAWLAWRRLLDGEQRDFLRSLVRRTGDSSRAEALR